MHLVLYGLKSLPSSESWKCVCVSFHVRLLKNGMKKSLRQARVNQLSVKLHVSLPGGLQVHVGWDR